MDVVFSYALCCTYATGQLNTAYREQYCGVVSRELRACTGWHRPDFFFQSPLSRGVYNHRLFYALLFRLPSVFFFLSPLYRGPSRLPPLLLPTDLVPGIFGHP